jgi:hypothetical protein
MVTARLREASVAVAADKEYIEEEWCREGVELRDEQKYAERSDVCFGRWMILFFFTWVMNTIY